MELTITPELKQDAIAILENMRVIVNNDMLIRGVYTETSVSRPDLIDSVCGGVKHCAIGSLWAAAGYKGQIHEGSHGYKWVGAIPNISEDERHIAFGETPALKLAYDALNKSAEEFSNRHDVDYPEYNDELEQENEVFVAAVEQLFENGVIRDDEPINYLDLLVVIDDAIKLIEVT